MSNSVAAVEEGQPLVTKDVKTVKIFGRDIALTKADYDFVVVFPILNDETEMEEAEQAFAKCFKRDVRMQIDNWRGMFRDKKVTKKDFQGTVWKTMVDYLTGRHSGFKVSWFPSIDKDELFLCIKCDSETVADALASEFAIMMPVTQEAYPMLGQVCPQISFGMFSGKEPAVGHVPYTKSRVDAYKKLVADRLAKHETTLNELLERRKRAEEEMAKLGKKIEARHTFHQEGGGNLHHELETLKRIIAKKLSNLEAPQVLLQYCLERSRSAATPEEGAELKDLFHLMSHRLEMWDQELMLASERIFKKSGIDELCVHREDRYKSFPSIKQLASSSLYQRFRPVDYTRLVCKQVDSGFDLGEMVKCGMVSKHFVVHDWHTQELLMKSWANPLKLLQLPNSHISKVRNYFGEVVGFFYHWMDSYIEMIMFPAIVGLATCLRFWMLDRRLSSIVISLYAFAMCLWTSLANARYTQLANERQFMWGMQDASSKVSKLRSFRIELQGGIYETAVRGCHYLFLLLLLTWTLFFAGFISKLRITAKAAMHHHHGHHDGTMVLPLFNQEVSAALVYNYATYIITANIKLTSYLWDFVSPLIADLENRDTAENKKNSQAFKTFIVKFTVYYYPFFYTAFVQPFIEGCGGEDPHDMEGCSDELRTNVAVFLLCHLAFTLFDIVRPLAVTRYLVWSESKKAKVDEPYDILQLQAKLPEYAGNSGIDYIDTVINLGFTTMFSCISPTMTFVCLLTLMIEARLFAFRDVYLSRRDEPGLTEGIGPWLSVMQIMAIISVMVNCGFLSFMMWPLRNFDTHHQLMFFLGLEHLIIAATVMLGKAFPVKTQDHRFAEDINQAFMDELLYDPDKAEKLSERQLEALVPSAMDLLPKTLPEALPSRE